MPEADQSSTEHTHKVNATSSDGSAPLPPLPTFGKQVLQLFVIPAIIVLVAVAVIVPIARLAGSRVSIENQLDILGGTGGLEKDRWTAAHQVARMIPSIKDEERAGIHAHLVETLRKSPEDEEHPLRAFIILAIGQLGQPGGLEAILPHADSPRAETRHSVAQAVLVWPDQQEARIALGALTKLLNDNQLRTQVLAAQALGLVAQPGDTSAINALLAVQQNNRSDRDLVWAASLALAKLGVSEGNNTVANLLLDRTALSQVTDVLDDGTKTDRTLSPNQQSLVIQRTLEHAPAMTDAMIWDKIQLLAEHDPDTAVRVRAGELLAQRRKAEPAPTLPAEANDQR